MVGPDEESCRRTRDALDTMLVEDFDAGLALDFLPEGQQFFLAGVLEPHLADHWQFRWRRHHDLATRILEHAATKRILLHGHAPHMQRLGGKRS